MKDVTIPEPAGDNEKYSTFSGQLEPKGRILEDPDYNVWGCSPIYGPDGRVHVFYSRWKNEYTHYGWVACCEIAHAVGDSPEGPFTHVDVALSGRGGDAWDSWSIHNPTVHKVGDQYAIFYMGSDGSKLGVTLEEISKMSKDEYEPYFHKLVQTKQVGLAVADDLNGPWRRVGDSKPVLERGEPGTWDDLCVSNPAFIHHPNGQCWLYFKGWDHDSNKKVSGNRKYGLAIADTLEGPYTKQQEINPIISFAHIDPSMQCEDAYLWIEEGKFNIILRDMGFYNHEYGLLMQSDDGISWSDPQIAYKDAGSYFNEKLVGLDREGRFERPQILVKDGKPEYLFCAYIGGEYNTSSGVVFKVAQA